MDSDGIRQSIEALADQAEVWKPIGKKLLHAIAFLKRELADGPRPKTELVVAAKVEGIGERTLDEAKKQSGIEAVKGSGRRHGPWLWRKIVILLFVRLLWMLPAPASQAFYTLAATAFPAGNGGHIANGADIRSGVHGTGGILWRSRGSELEEKRTPPRPEAVPRNARSDMLVQGMASQQRAQSSELEEGMKTSLRTMYSAPRTCTLENSAFSARNGGRSPKGAGNHLRGGDLVC